MMALSVLLVSVAAVLGVVMVISLCIKFKRRRDSDSDRNTSPQSFPMDSVRRRDSISERADPSMRQPQPLQVHFHGPVQILVADEKFIRSGGDALMFGSQPRNLDAIGYSSSPRITEIPDSHNSDNYESHTPQVVVNNTAESNSGWCTIQ
ncbi:uncharacterized protein LOC121376739 [Gigantopelta aegis]|uniref:uncharacterized protein LOC121376739 n=1 Tax=Gigantopelta aegis TaxID=1735272 RepID=UPI001B88CAEC|nr:uncharacterized protein LOC121376739 [Gigantopelta aegis]